MELQHLRCGTGPLVINWALDTCIELIDDIDTINNVVPELASIVKGGVGLNSANASCKIRTLKNICDPF